MKTALRTLLRSFALLLLAALIPSQPAFAQKGKGRDCLAELGPLPPLVHGRATVIDGDTIRLDGYAPSVRLWGIQAPELRNKQTSEELVTGMRARAALADIMGRHNDDVVCLPTKYDRHCRTVARCHTAGATPADQTWLSEEMLTRGYAYGAWLDDVGPDQPALGQRFYDLEATARAEKRGLWKDWSAEK